MTESTSRRSARAPARRERPVRSARARLVAVAERHVREGSSVVVMGAPGAGRSYLAARVVDTVPDLRVVAVRSATATSGLVVTVVHDPAEPSAVGSVRHLVDGTTSTALVTEAVERPGLRTVVLADDAHLLDLVHLRALRGLAVDGRIVLLATCDTLDTVERARTESVDLLTTLWRDGGAERVDLLPLTDDEAHTLVRAVAGAQPVDLAARHTIVAAGGGSPATIWELTQSVVRGPADGRPDALRVLAAATPSPRAVERARRRLANLSGYEQDALVLLARLDGFDAERGGRYVGDATLRRLVQHGCVSASDPDPGVLRAARTDADVVLSSRPTDGAGHPLGRALGSMVELDAAGLCLEPSECALLSDAWLGAAGDPEAVTPGVTAVQVSRISTVAARRSTAARSPYRALSHAVQALDALPTVAAAVEASRALAALENRRAARAVLDRAPGDATGPELELLHLWRAELDDWGLLEGPRAGVGLRSADGPLPRSVETLRSTVVAMRRMRWEEALGSALRLVDDEQVGIVVRLRACSAASRSAAFLARGTQLARVERAGLRLHEELVLECGSATAQVAVDEGAALLAGSLAARLTCGLGWAGAPAELDRLMQRATGTGNLAHTVVLSALAGYHALVSDEVAVAEHELRVAHERLGQPTSHDLRAWVLAVRASALTRRGRREEALDLCAELEGPGAEATPWSRCLAGAARGRSPSGLGEPAGLPAPEGVEDPETYQPTITLLVAAEAVRASDGRSRAPDLVDAAATVREQTDIGSLQALADYVVASSQSDARTLADLTSTFEALGMPRLAAACEGQASGLLDPDSPHLMSAWRDRADGRPSEQAGTGEPLTDREAEVAGLAGRGLTNRQIAERLYLSVRTVESHVYLARRKLGAASRHDLGARLVEDGLS